MDKAKEEDPEMSQKYPFKEEMSVSNHIKSCDCKTSEPFFFFVENIKS